MMLRRRRRMMIVKIRHNSISVSQFSFPGTPGSNSSAIMMMISGGQRPCMVGNRRVNSRNGLFALCQTLESVAAAAAA